MVFVKHLEGKTQNLANANEVFMLKHAIIAMLFFSFLLICAGCRDQDDPNLLEAVRSGDMAELKRLLAAGGNVHTSDHRGNTLLHMAAQSGRCADIELLLENGARVGSRDDGGSTPLHAALTNCHTEAVKLLVEKGANVNARNKNGRTPIFPAAKCGNLELVKFLVDKGARIPTTGFTPLHAAARGYQNTAVVGFFLDSGVEVNAKGDSATGGAGSTPLHVAATRASKSVVELLIERGAKVDAKAKGGQTPLFGAALSGNTETAEVLIANGADVNARNSLRSTPLHRAVKLNNFAGAFTPNDFAGFVQLLIAYGANVNAQDNRKNTPLHCAVAGGWPTSPTYETIIGTLLANGANVNVKDRYGRTPISLAHGKPDIIALLKKYESKE